MNDELNDLSDEEGGLPRPKFPAHFAGQQLFIRGEDWRNNAMLGWSGFSGELYAAGYKDAADALVEALAERKASLDSVVYPLVFLYRQAIELQLKLILPLARRLAGKAPVDDHKHFLPPLWNELHLLLKQLDPPGDDQDLKALGALIQQLDQVDPASFAFRYHKDKQGQVSLPALSHINVRHLAEVMDSVFLLLGGIHSWLGDMDYQEPL